jgi:putative inorganic carbon (HCO3(-)) transporter
MDASMFFRVIDTVLGFFGKLLSGSFLADIFKAKIEDVLDHSVVIRLIRGFFRIFITLRRSFFKTAYENSGFVMLMNSFSALILGSFVGQRLAGALGIEPERPNKLNWLPTAILFTGIASLGVASFFFPIRLALIGAAVFVAAIIAFACPELCIIGIAAAAPFLPTMTLAVALGYCFACFVFKLLTNSSYSPDIDLTGYMIIIYAVAGIFVGATSLSPSSSINIVMLTTLFMSSHILIVILINSRKKLDFMLFAFCTSAAVTGLIGLYQKVSGMVDQTWVDKELFEEVQLRIYSTFQNPNVYGAYLLLAIPMCLVMAYMARKWYAKVYYSAISVLLLYNLGFTYSRGCYLALAVGLLIFILFTERRLIAVFVAGVIALPFVIPASMLARLLSITNLEDSSTSFRIYIWQATLRILKDYWFAGLGQGIEAYNVVYPLYSFSNVPAPHSHNLYLQVFVETGIWGLLIFLSLLIAFFNTQARLFIKTRNAKLKIFLAAIMAAACAFLFQGVFDYVFYNYRVMLTFFVFTGMAGSMVSIRMRSDFT